MFQSPTAIGPRSSSNTTLMAEVDVDPDDFMERTSDCHVRYKKLFLNIYYMNGKKSNNIKCAANQTAKDCHTTQIKKNINISLFVYNSGLKASM
jgi:hypothetical protein